MDQSTIDTYNKIAREYDETISTFWDKVPRTFLNTFIELSGESIVDIGSGTGRDALLLRSEGKRVVCVDGSEAMVKLSSEKGFESFVAGFDTLPFSDRVFDGAWSYTALLHVPKDSIRKAINEIRRVLKPSGLFALGMIEGDTEGYRENIGEGMRRWFSYYTKEELEHICKECSFETVYFESFVPSPKDYSSVRKEGEGQSENVPVAPSRSYLNFLFRKV